MKTAVPDSWAYSVRVGVETVESGVPYNREHLLPVLTPPLIPEREKYSLVIQAPISYRFHLVYFMI